jgi:hypothetical protein
VRAPPNRKIKRTLVAHADLERLGANPIEMLVDVYREAMTAFKQGRGLSDKGDAGAAYLGVAGKAAVDLAKFRHPTLSAVAITEQTPMGEPMTTKQAINILKSDPFAPQEIKDIDTARIVEAIDSTISTPFLPPGNDGRAD